MMKTSLTGRRAVRAFFLLSTLSAIACGSDDGDSPGDGGSQHDGGGVDGAGHGDAGSADATSPDAADGGHEGDGGAVDAADGGSSDAGILDASDSGVVDASDSSVVDASDSGLADASDSSVVDASDSSVVDASDSSVVDASDSGALDASDSSVVDASDSGTIVTDAGAQDSATTPDAATGGFVSNMPGATLVDVTSPPAGDLILVSSNFLQEPSGSQFYEEWLGEVRNVGTAVACLIRVDVSFKNAAGNEVAKLHPYVDGQPYAYANGKTTMACIAPGETGSFWTNAFAPGTVSLGDVRKIEVKFGPHVYSNNGLHPHTPIIVSHPQSVPGNNAFGVGGTITGVGGAIYNIGVDIFPRDAQGLVIGHLWAGDLHTLNPGVAFPFTTGIGVATSFAEYRQFPDFIDGAEPDAGQPMAPSFAAFSAADDARRERQEKNARAAMARQGGPSN
jgi:hypothetical protein